MLIWFICIQWAGMGRVIELCKSSRSMGHGFANCQTSSWTSHDSCWGLLYWMIETQFTEVFFFFHRFHLFCSYIFTHFPTCFFQRVCLHHLFASWTARWRRLEPQKSWVNFSLAADLPSTGIYVGNMLLMVRICWFIIKSNNIANIRAFDIMGWKLLFYSSNTNNQDIHQPSEMDALTGLFGTSACAFMSQNVTCRPDPKGEFGLLFGLWSSASVVSETWKEWWWTAWRTWSVGKLGHPTTIGDGSDLQHGRWISINITSQFNAIQMYQAFDLYPYCHILPMLRWFESSTVPLKCCCFLSPLEIVSSAAMFSGGCGDTRNICQSLGRIGKA